MKILSLLWPWAEIARLRSQLAVAQEQSRAFQSALNEVDPLYFVRKWGEMNISSPQMNCRLTGIDVGQL